MEYAKVQAALDEAGILGGLPLEDGRILWCATELTGKAQIDGLIRVLEGISA